MMTGNLTHFKNMLIKEKLVAEYCDARGHAILFGALFFIASNALIWVVASGSCPELRGPAIAVVVIMFGPLVYYLNLEAKTRKKIMFGGE